MDRQRMRRALGGGAEAVGDIQGHPALQRTYEMGKTV